MALRDNIPPPGPMRKLVAATVVTTTGNGLSLTASTLYAVRVVRVSNHQLGIGLSIAAVVALVVGLGIGHAADRLGSRTVLLLLLGAQGSLSVLYAFVRSYPLFLFAIIGLAIANQGGANVRGALVAQMTNPETRVRERAFLRAVTNFGIGVGSLVGGVAVSIDTPTAYSTIILIDALSFFASMYFIAQLPQVKPQPAEQTLRATAAMRDKPFVFAAGLTGLLCMHYSMLTLAVPLWVVEQTKAPKVIVAAALTANTIMCVLFQVRASKGTDDVMSSAKVVRQSTLLLAAACIVYWLAHGRSSFWAAVLIMIGALIHVVGELRQSSGTWGMGYGLAPENAQGQYQAVWQSSFTVGNLVGPPLLAGFVVTSGLTGWVVLAVIFLVAGAAMPPITRWSQQRLAADA